MDQVRIRATVSAHGMTKGAETPDPIAATPLIEGGIRNGVFTELERITPKKPASPEDIARNLGGDLNEPEEGQHASVQDETPVPDIEELELPPSADVHDLEPEQDKPKGRRG